MCILGNTHCCIIFRPTRPQATITQWSSDYVFSRHTELVYMSLSAVQHQLCGKPGLLTMYTHGKCQWPVVDVTKRNGRVKWIPGCLWEDAIRADSLNQAKRQEPCLWKADLGRTPGFTGSRKCPVLQLIGRKAGACSRMLNAALDIKKERKEKDASSSLWDLFTLNCFWGFQKSLWEYPYFRFK